MQPGPLIWHPFARVGRGILNAGDPSGFTSPSDREQLEAQRICNPHTPALWAEELAVSGSLAEGGPAPAGWPGIHQGPSGPRPGRLAGAGPVGGWHGRFRRRVTDSGGRRPVSSQDDRFRRPR